MSTGIVKEFNSERGFGSIQDSETGRLLTVYQNYLNLEEGETLIPGQKVKFDIKSDRNGDWAVNVSIFKETE